MSGSWLKVTRLIDGLSRRKRRALYWRLRWLTFKRRLAYRERRLCEKLIGGFFDPLAAPQPSLESPAPRRKRRIKATGVIVLNRILSFNQKIYVLAHELGHACRYRRLRRRDQTLEEEARADRFAYRLISYLIPRLRRRRRSAVGGQWAMS